MQNSLNQAFIRAYAKDRDASHQRSAAQESQSQAAQRKAQEELIMRIDTTSVDIPRPYLLKPNPTKQSVATGVPRTLDAASQRDARPAPEPKKAEDAQEDALRAQIAAEMLRAGEFQSEQIASLNSFFSIRSTVSSPSANSNLNAPMVASLAGESRGSSGMDEELDQPPTFVGRSPILAQAQVTQSTRSGAIVRVDTPADATASRVDERKPEPAKEQVNSQDESRRAATARAFVKQTSIGKIKVTTQPNLPTSALPASKAPMSPTPMSPVPMSPAAIEEPKADLQSARHAAAVAETRQVESELRQAKVRVFNPVWEVDQLQWPEVCVRLIETRTESLAHVTKHLIDACQEGLQVLAVTSPEGGEGRTTVACCLAMLAGSRGLKVVVVDGDVDNPTLSIQTNLDIESDWQTALTNQLPLEEVAVHSIDDQITLVPLMAPLDQDELPLNDHRIATMLTELSESFDLVIVDMGHMSSPNNLMQTLADRGIINAAIAVIDYRTTTPQRIETCIRRIRQAGVSSVGLVENFAA